MRTVIVFVCFALSACATDPGVGVEQLSQEMRDDDPAPVYDESTAPLLVEEEFLDITGRYPIHCGWDRCGPDGGYVCTDGSVIVVWQRGTNYLQVGLTGGCVRGGTSCYACPGNGDF